MRNKINNILDKVNFIIIICLIILVPITFFINYFSLFHFHSQFTFKIHQVLTYILPIEIIIYFYKLFSRKHRIDIFDLLGYLLILFAIVSALLAPDFKLALWGSIYRYEGLIQICAYYVLFLNSRFINTKELIVKVINSLIIIGLLQFIYSFLQVFIRGTYIYVKYEYVYYRASGFIGHPNMLGSYIVLTLLLAIGMYFLYGKHKKFYLISIILLYINLILTQSTGPFYGFIVGLIFTLIFLYKKKKIDILNILTCTISIIIGLLLVSGITELWCTNRFHDQFRDDFTIVGDIKDTFVTFGQVITSNMKYNNSGVSSLETYGSNRIWLWKNTIKLVPKYWLHGTGIDNFTQVFRDNLSEKDKNISYLGGALFDRAHNEYLHLLVTQGVFAFVTYLALLILIFIKGIKSKDTMVWILLFGFVGYAIQAFTNISVYNVAPFFFIVMGMLVGKENIVKGNEKQLN